MAEQGNGQGRGASSPLAIPPGGWLAVLKRAWAEQGKDNISLISAGVAFYGFLALVPVIAATVLIYGLAADPATVAKNVQSLTSIMPPDAAKLVGQQLSSAVHTSGGKKGLGLVVALALALFSARSGATAVVTALNVAYDEEEKRGFFKLNLVALAITLAAVLMAVLAAVAIASMAKLEAMLPNTNVVVLTIGRVISYLVLAAVGAAAVATLYRYGPSRETAKWTWLTPGSLFSAVFWILLTLGFGIYVSKFGNYNATYGSLGAIVVMLTWLYLSAYVLLFGAELNSELEHQTAKDTTTSGGKPIGQRGAEAADTVAGDDARSGKGGKPAVGSSESGDGEPSQRAEYLKGRAAARVAGTARLGKVGMVTTGLATVGLARLRREGKAVQGLGLLAAAAALAWWRRRE